MRVVLEYYEIEELAWCEKENGEWYPVAEDTELELSVDEVEFDRDDLEEIVEQYKDEVIDILLRDHYDDLLEVLKSKNHAKLTPLQKSEKTTQNIQYAENASFTVGTPDDVVATPTGGAQKRRR